jgi:hypothetical protein
MWTSGTLTRVEVLRAGVSWILLLMASTTSADTKNSEKVYDGMPSAERVLKAIKGSDPKQTCERQIQALGFLWDIVAFQKLTPTYRTSDWPIEVELKNEYNAAMGKVSREFESLRSSAKTESAKTLNRYVLPGADIELQNEVVNLMTEPTRTLCRELLPKGSIGQSQGAGNLQPQQTSTFQDPNTVWERLKFKKHVSDSGLPDSLGGLAGLILSIFLIVRGNRTFRRLHKYEFENRTDGGVVGFESYEASLAHRRKKVWAQFVGQGGGVLALISIIYLVGGIIEMNEYYGWW